jgi:hypothetical protein
MNASANKKKTPRDATEIEREQLRFFLTRDDLALTLAEINPSIAWLPWLAEMKLLQPGTQLAPWIERNFAEPDAVHDVVSNIHYFNPDTAELLEFRLNRQLESLSPLLVKCWRIIIRFMRGARRGVLASDWFDVAPLVKRGEQSQEVLERLSIALKPRLKIGSRISWHDDEPRNEPQKPTDLMRIDYEIEDGLSEDDVLSVWPKDTPAETDERLLRILTETLGGVLADAIEVGVESNQGYAITDTDVPSVASHQQNAYRAGFLPIVRVMAELWTGLAAKNSALALQILELWRHSEYRLVRRLALFAAANAVVPTSTVAELLMSLPHGELFITNSSVEVYRLLHQRWGELAANQRTQIEDKIAEGPPVDWFREGADTSRIIDRCRFDLLGDLQRSGLELTEKSNSLLEQIRDRRPQWQLRPPEQAGFHIWTGSSRAIVGDPDKLKDVSDEDLVTAAEKVASEADFLEGDAWQALCQSDPARALRGLSAQAHKGQWSVSAWDPFLWAAKKLDDPSSVAQVAQLLLDAPQEAFAKMASSASWWVNEQVKALTEPLLWRLWDRIAENVPPDDEEDGDA